MILGSNLSRVLDLQWICRSDVNFGMLRTMAKISHGLIATYIRQFISVVGELLKWHHPGSHLRTNQHMAMHIYDFWRLFLAQYSTLVGGRECSRGELTEQTAQPRTNKPHKREKRQAGREGRQSRKRGATGEEMETTIGSYVYQSGQEKGRKGRRGEGNLNGFGRQDRLPTVIEFTLV